MLDNNKGLKELFPESRKQLKAYSKSENTIRKSRRYSKEGSKLRKNLRNSISINKEINKTHIQEPPATNIKYRYNNNPSYATDKNQENYIGLNLPLIYNFYEYFKVKKGLQMLNLLSAFFVAILYTVIISILTSPNMGLVFFTLLFSVTFTGLNEQFILDELKNSRKVTDTEKSLGIKELDMKITFLIMSLGLCVPLILLYIITIL